MVGMILGESIASFAHNAPETVRIVGSSSVFPFSALVAERVGIFQEFSSPIVEKTGTGAGIKLFCAGTDSLFPDIVNTSRLMTEKERQLCISHGVDHLLEIKIGYGGIVLVRSKRSTDQEISLKDLTLEDLFRALSRDVFVDGAWVKNPYQYWSDLSPDLPQIPIVVFGPPSTSGIRDSLREIVFEPYCAQHSKNPPHCGMIREDGAYIEMPENTMIIVQKLEANPHALGIVAYPFLDQNQDILEAVSVQGVFPALQTILTGTYVLARPLYFYVKGDTLKTKSTLRSYVSEFLDDNMYGEDSPLSEKGLIPLNSEERLFYQTLYSSFIHSKN